MAEPEDFKAHFQAVYSRDNPGTPPYGWVQWKGTDVCIDLHCDCGHHGHYDGEFFYYYQCPQCGRKFAVGQNVKLIPLTEAQVSYCEKRSEIFNKPSE